MCDALCLKLSLSIVFLSLYALFAPVVARLLTSTLTCTHNTINATGGRGGSRRPHPAHFVRQGVRVGHSLAVARSRSSSKHALFAPVVARSLTSTLAYAHTTIKESGGRGGSRTLTVLTDHRILSPRRLPVPPLALHTNVRRTAFYNDIPAQRGHPPVMNTAVITAHHTTYERNGGRYRTRTYDLLHVKQTRLPTAPTAQRSYE